MDIYYSSEKNVQILIALLKKHNIKRIIASPGATNICFVASAQNDPYFEIYSSIDERSAAYIACGMAAESQEPVVLSCTAATASRNYIPGLTETFYRKLPILAVTSTRHISQIGHNIDQVVDRTNLLNDIAKLSVHLPIPHNEETEWECEIKINKALLELQRHGGGPVHINLTTSYDTDFSVRELPQVRTIKRISYTDDMPKLKTGKTGIFVGAHTKWSDKLIHEVELFCENYNAVVLCDSTSNYKGKYGIYFNLLIHQKKYHAPCLTMDTMIHIGDISASSIFSVKDIWRVNPDGEVRDTFRKLKYVFEMEEIIFFEKMNCENKNKTKNTDFYDEWIKESNNCQVKLLEKENELPYSNVWMTLQMHDKLPLNSVLHLGILNSLRSWNFFKVNDTILEYSNTGGFGIDGGISSLIGASLINKEKIYFGIVGDLAFFYDLNAIGNRHIGNNIRIMIINNGLGVEFKTNMNLAQRAGIGEATDKYIAAAGHFGKKSPYLVKHYSEDLGFEYLSASNKEEFLINIKKFLSFELFEKPIIFETFTESRNEVDAIEMIQNLEVSMTSMAKDIAKNVIGNKGVEKLKKVLKR